MNDVSLLPERYTAGWYLVQDAAPWRKVLGAMKQTDHQQELLVAIVEDNLLTTSISEVSMAVDVSGPTVVRELLLRSTPAMVLNAVDDPSPVLIQLADAYPVHDAGYECTVCDAEFIFRVRAARHQQNTNHLVEVNTPHDR